MNLVMYPFNKNLMQIIHTEWLLYHVNLRHYVPLNIHVLYHGTRHD